MNRLLIKLYTIIPNKIKHFVGNISWLSVIRNLLLKQHGIYRETHAFITRSYENYLVDFEFYGSIKDVAKASKGGIENTLLKNSFKLINTYIKHQDDCVIFDIGANFGYLSLVWGTSICSKNGRLYAFEPNLNVYSTFKKSIGENNLSKIIKAEQKAVGFKNKTIELYLDNTTSNVEKNPNSNNTVLVDMVSLDSYFKQNKIDKCDLIKIDVDGIEYNILIGSIKTILNFKPIVIVETNNDIRIIEFFKNHNYKILNMKLEEYLVTDEIPLNIFCLPN